MCLVQPADYDRIKPLAERYSLKLIQDSCEALGAQYKTRPVGMQGDYGVFAFYPNKQITTGEGGMIVTDDHEAAQFMRALRNQGALPAIRGCSTPTWAITTAWMK